MSRGLGEWKDEAQTVEEEIGKLKKEVEDLQEQLQATDLTECFSADWKFL